ncbi:dimethylaniline monooxygenase [N-oxide-forming] 5-like protein [Leptotrombidium deliense]|uniref:Flavin-containing monooxygenase n=1 Tax=Leptotrombidium deliense TaxID=299467 RepID=A0A443S6J0_9ACAR|nr:dimethylaniline monooxygenase [N-oxide-forming] 5-like protein [Leptotrombidium deliense]
MNPTKRKQICVVGAGSSGLTAIKQCLDQNFDVHCFEQSDNFGGLWRYRDEEDGFACVPKTTIINTSKEISAFSDFPPPSEYANFMDHRKMCNYLELYARHFDLLRHIHYNHIVLNVAPNSDHEETGKWRVKILNNEENKSFVKVFDGVMVCVGHHSFPYFPKFPGQEKFKGKIIHTRSYKSPKDFKDNVAVVIGIGNSGADIAADLSNVCSQVYIATRSGSWIFQRVQRNGLPLDLIFNTRLVVGLMSLLPTRIVNVCMEYYVNTFFDHRLYGLNPKHRIMEQQTTANDYISSSIISGKILVRENINRFTENGVIFEGMGVETKCDVVVFATGYDILFPFIDSTIISVNNNEVNLFKNVFQAALKHAHTLAIIGLCQPSGSFFPIAEMQSRWFALLMKGDIKLPKKEEMLKIIEEDTKAVKRRFYTSKRHTIQIGYIPYMDLLATYIGCKPNLFRIALTDVKLWFQLIYGPMMSYQYRLTGPNQWVGARDALLNYKQRFVAPFKC